MQFKAPSDLTQISIGIQARSTSKRFPRKIFEMVGEKMIIQHVYDSCESAAKYLQRQSFKNKTNISIYILAPAGDELVKVYADRVIEGSETDVLSRYLTLQEHTDADYIVRITADCPLIPHYLISKAVNLALKNNYDYCSNVQESARTTVDGFDVEVISKRAMEWLKQNATSKDNKEHVTLALRSGSVPPYFKIGHMIGNLYLPYVKLSVDTKEDLDRVREEYASIKQVINVIEHLPGKNHIHRY